MEMLNGFENEFLLMLRQNQISHLLLPQLIIEISGFYVIFLTCTKHGLKREINS